LLEITFAGLLSLTVHGDVVAIVLREHLYLRFAVTRDRYPTVVTQRYAHLSRKSLQAAADSARDIINAAMP
jgi:hypothetical protein